MQLLKRVVNSVHKPFWIGITVFRIDFIALRLYNVLEINNCHWYLSFAVSTLKSLIIFLNYSNPISFTLSMTLTSLYLQIQNSVIPNDQKLNTIYVISRYRQDIAINTII